MNHRHASRFAAVAALLVLQACGGSGGGDSTDDGDGGYSGTGPGSAALFCEAFADTFAQRYIDCEKAAPAWVTEFIQKSEICGRINYAVDNGRATYDDAAAGECIAFFETATCTEIRGFRDDVVFVQACQDAVMGKGARNTECMSDYDCASGRCDATLSPAKCQATYAGCGTDRDCAPGYYCYMGSLWVDHSCQPFSNRPGLDQVCNEGTGCQVGLQCEGSVGVVFDGTCKPQKTEGSCEKEPGLTAIGYGCLGSYPSYTVQPYVGPGATCTGPDNCGPGLYCGLVGSGDLVCLQEPLVGEACALTDPDKVCIGGTCPQVTDATCMDEGIPTQCFSDWDCDSYGYCETGTGCEWFPL